MKMALMSLMLTVLLLSSFASAEDDSTAFLALPGFESKVGVAFKREEVEMVAVYRGNNLYLRPLSRKLRLLLGKEKAVATKTLSLPKLVRDEATRGEEMESSLLISGRSFAKPSDTFSINLEGKGISGRFTEEKGNEAQMGIVLFLGKKGVRIYQFSVDAEGLTAHFHTLTEKQYKAAKKSVEEKLKAAGQKGAAKKVGKL